MTEEYLDILDEQGNKTGESRPYLECHEKGLIHTAVHVWIVNSKNEVLIQKREKNRRFFPEHWDISAAGHVSAGQTNLEAAIRETEEELGLNFNKTDFNLLCTLWTDSLLNNGAFRNREFNPVYVVRADIKISDIKLDDGEVEAVKFLSFDDFKDWTQGKGEKMVPHEEEYRKLIEYLEKYPGDEEFNRIKQIYISSLEIPKMKPEKQFLLCPVGLVGAGKSTVVIPLSKKLNLVRLSHDDIRKLLKENGFNYDRSKEMAMQIIKEFLDQGYSVALDANCGSEDSLRRIQEIKKSYGLKVLWIHINPPEEFIVNKLKNFNHTWLFNSGDEAVEGYFRYKKDFGDFQNLPLGYIYTFDTSKSDLEYQIKEAEDKINNLWKTEK